MIIQLLIKKERIQDLESVLKVNEKGISESVELIDQTDKEYYLLIEHKKQNNNKIALQLGKDNFEGIIYVSEGKK